MSTTTTDRIEKQILLRAPRARVWRALADAKEFGAWFQAAFEGPFRPGATVRGRITYPGYEHLTMEIEVEAMEPERRLALRWHPNAVEPGVDYSGEPTTLVEFELEDAPGGTRLTLTESGFDRIPIARRAAALKSNDAGWSAQMKAIEDYLRRNP
jgi:uncharacterized protein YndB with AHSA1/START domain